MDEKKMQEAVKRHNEIFGDPLLPPGIVRVDWKKDLRTERDKQNIEIERLKKLLMEMIEENAELSAEVYLMKREKEALGYDGTKVD